MEQANKKLRQEVAKRDKGIDELKAKMQQMQEQHGKLVLTINRQLIGEWFKEQFDKLRHSLRRPIEEPRKSRELKM